MRSKYIKFSKNKPIITLKTGTKMFVCTCVRASVCEKCSCICVCVCGCGGQRTTMGVISLSCLVRKCLLRAVALAK